jgi:hypothetical protein
MKSDDREPQGMLSAGVIPLKLEHANGAKRPFAVLRGRGVVELVTDSGTDCLSVLTVLLGPQSYDYIR